MRLYAPIVAAAMALLINGCILPVPLPHMEKEWNAIDGKVLDKVTGLPVAGAEVRVAYDERWPAKKRTGADGRFHFGAKYIFMPVLLIGPHDTMNTCTLLVKANGYAEENLEAHSFARQDALFATSNQEETPYEIYEDRLHLTIRLRRSPCEPPEKTSPD